MRHLLKSVLCTGALLLTACGAEGVGEAIAPDLGTAEQAILPETCGMTPNQIVYYYSDSARTIEVGRRTCNCDGSAVMQGTETRYWRSVPTTSCP